MSRMMLMCTDMSMCLRGQTATVLLQGQRELLMELKTVNSYKRGTDWLGDNPVMWDETIYLLSCKSKYNLLRISEYVSNQEI